MCKGSWCFLSFSSIWTCLNLCISGGDHACFLWIIVLQAKQTAELDLSAEVATRLTLVDRSSSAGSIYDAQPLYTTYARHSDEDLPRLTRVRENVQLTQLLAEEMHSFSSCHFTGNGSRGEWSSNPKWSQPGFKFRFQAANHTTRPGHAAGRRLAQWWGDMCVKLCFCFQLEERFFVSYLPVSAVYFILHYFQLWESIMNWTARY